MGIFFLERGLQQPSFFNLLPGIFPFVILVVAYLYQAKTYDFTDNFLVIKQRGKSVQIPLKEILSFEHIISAGNIRTFGIGGLFGYIGKFNGNENWYVTNKQKLIKINTQNAVYVVSPEDTDDFKNKLKAIIKFK